MTDIDFSYLKNICWTWKKYGISDHNIKILKSMGFRTRPWYVDFHEVCDKNTFINYVKQTNDKTVIKYYTKECLKYNIITPDESITFDDVMKYCNYDQIEKYYKKFKPNMCRCPYGNFDALLWYLNKFQVMTKDVCLGDNLSYKYMKLIMDNIIVFDVYDKKHVFYTLLKFNYIDLAKSYDWKIENDKYFLEVKPDTIDDLEFITSSIGDKVVVKIDPDSCMNFINKSPDRFFKLDKFNMYSNMEWETCFIKDKIPEKYCNNIFPCKNIVLSESDWRVMINAAVYDNSTVNMELYKMSAGEEYNSICFFYNNNILQFDKYGFFNVYLSPDNIYDIVMMFATDYSTRTAIYINHIKASPSDFIIS